MSTSNKLALPPGKPILKKRLQAKQKEYIERKEGKGYPWAAMGPELAHKTHPDYRGACYKHAILTRVLLNIGVDIEKMAAQLATEHGEDFHRDEFDNAVLVIQDYIAEDTSNLSGGTGLPDAD